MSNPLFSLKKSKKPPLYLPEVHTPSPSSSPMDMNKTTSSEDNSYKFSLNFGMNFLNRTPNHANKHKDTHKS